MSRNHHSAHHGREKTVVVAVPKPDAADVRITGSFCDWNPDGHPLKRDAHGFWHGKLHLGPGRYEYRLLADGSWLDDPTCAERVPNPFGSENCVMTVT